MVKQDLSWNATIGTTGAARSTLSRLPKRQHGSYRRTALPDERRIIRCREPPPAHCQHPPTSGLPEAGYGKKRGLALSDLSLGVERADDSGLLARRVANVVAGA